MKKFITLSIALTLSLFAWFGFSAHADKKLFSKTDYSWLHEGDILFQDMGGDFGEAIRLATLSKFSHCGMVLKKGEDVYVFEAVGPVKFTPIKEWVSHGTGKAFTAKRLIKETMLTPEILKNWQSYSTAYSGKAYDHVFGWNDDKIYCSELVWKMYKKAGIELSTPKHLKDFDLSHPLVKQQLNMRYGKNIPYEENVVAPQDLFESVLLKEISGPALTKKAIK